ncbi:MAG: energy-coupled thiamine transporter ThiT [Bacilli bacterium]
MNTQENVSSRKSSSKGITQITICSMMLALAFVLAIAVKYIPGMHFANGGSISVAMVPLALVSFYCGPLWGTFIGMAFGALDMVLDGGFVYNWVSIFLDYIFAFGFAGICSVFRKQFYERKIWSLVAGMSVFGILRFLCSFLSGCIVWNGLNGEENYTGFLSSLIPDFSSGSITYSLSYNAGYMLPSIALSIIILVLLASPVFTTLSNSRIRSLYDGEITPSKELKLDQKILSTIYLSVSLLIAVLSTIPALKISFIGYFSLVFSLSLIVYCLVNYHRASKTPETSVKDKYSLLFILLSFIPIAVSILGIISYYTYGSAVYLAE